MRGWVCSVTRPDAPSSDGSAADLPPCRSWPTNYRSAAPPSPNTSRCSATAAWSYPKPEGTRRIYRLNPHGVGALRTWLEGVWDQALTDFHKAAEQTAADNRFADPSADRLHPEQEQP